MNHKTWNSSELHYLLALTHIPTIGPRLGRKLIKLFGSPQDCFPSCGADFTVLMEGGASIVWLK